MELRILFPLIAAAIFLGACNPTMYVTRQKDLGIKPQSIQSDRFIYDRPSGPVDILFVVDTTETGYVVPDLHSQLITKVAAALRSDRFRNVSYRMQVITNPGRLNPGTFFDPKSTSCFITALVGGSEDDFKTCGRTPGSELLSPIKLDSGALDSLEIAGEGVFSFGVDNLREGAPLFVIFVQGADIDAFSANQQREKFELSMTNYQKPRRFFRSVSKNVSQPTCKNSIGDMLLPAPQLESSLRSSSNSDDNYVAENICDSITINGNKVSANATTLAQNIIEHIANVRTDLWLSKKSVYLPDAMIVSSSNHRFAAGTDYTYDPLLNKVIWLKKNLLQPGDPIEVVYFIGPSTDDLGGSPLPGNPK